MIPVVVALFDAVDVSFAGWLSAPSRVVCWAAVSGVVSMLMYGWCSPQKRIRAIERLAANVQKRLRDHRGDFAEALPLLKENILLAASRLKAALLPSLLAGTPVIFVIIGIQETQASTTVLPFGPGWLRSWLAAFVLVSGLSAMFTKLALRIR